jgi:hypothetical protein
LAVESSRRMRVGIGVDLLHQGRERRCGRAGGAEKCSVRAI